MTTDSHVTSNAELLERVREYDRRHITKDVGEPGGANSQSREETTAEEEDLETDEPETEEPQREPTEAEVEEVRRDTQKMAKSGRKRIKALAKWAGRNPEASGKAPATVFDLLCCLSMLRGESMDFTIAHVKKRAVLRDELPDGLSAIAPNWRGVYAIGKTYSSGAVCCHHNALWIAKEATAKKPGEADSGWVLVMKSPR